MTGEVEPGWCGSDGTGELWGVGARLEDAPDAARGVSREDGRADSAGPVGGADRAVLSEGGARSPSVSSGGDAAGTLCAVVLQPQRPGHGGPALRGGVGAALCRPAAVGFAAGRDDDRELPPSVGGARSGGSVVRGDRRALGHAGASVEDGDDRGREHRCRPVIDEEPHARRTGRRRWIGRWR